MYRYFLDGTLLQDEPLGWDQLVTTLKRDRVLKGILKTIDTQITFIGDGYDYLNNTLNNNSFCANINIEIQKSCDGGNTYSNFYTGIIFISDVEFDLKRCIARTKIQDNSFYAKINNNKSQEFLPFVSSSKNGITINSPTLQQIKFFNPANGTYYAIPAPARSCVGYKIYDVLKFAIDFMTDSSVDFDSLTFGSGGTWEGILMTFGMVVSTVTSGGLDQSTFEENFPKLTYEKLFSELDKLLNLGFYVDYSGSRPKIFIESDTLMRNSTEILNATDVDELKVTTAVDYLYSTINLGCNNYNENSTLNFPPDINFLGWKPETYNILGTCNIDRNFDLSKDWVYDSNSFEDALINSDTTFDTNIFIVNCTFVSGVVWESVKSNTLSPSGSPPFYYNEDFTNEQVAVRYFGGVPNSIASYLTNTDERFQATKTSNTIKFIPTTIEPVKFENDFALPNFDAANNYNTTTFEYDIPFSGIYSFYSLINGGTSYSSAFNGLTQSLYIKLRRYDAAGFTGGNLITETDLFSTTITSNQGITIPFSHSGSASIVANANDKICILVYTLTSSSFMTSRMLAIYAGSVFACTGSQFGGGVYHQYNPNDYSVLLSKFKYPFSDTDYTNILTNVRGQIKYNRNGDNSRLGWIETIKFDHKSGQADFMLNANKKINQ